MEGAIAAPAEQPGADARERGVPHAGALDGDIIRAQPAAQSLKSALRDVEDLALGFGHVDAALDVGGSIVRAARVRSAIGDGERSGGLRDGRADLFQIDEVDYVVGRRIICVLLERDCRAGGNLLQQGVGFVVEMMGGGGVRDLRILVRQAVIGPRVPRGHRQLLLEGAVYVDAQGRVDARTVCAVRDGIADDERICRLQGGERHALTGCHELYGFAS